MKWLAKKEKKVKLLVEYLIVLNDMTKGTSVLLNDKFKLEESIKETKKEIERLTLDKK
ncbi:hypothetical protein ACM26V_00375 [Salipaludibacillus sp. HK11]|uniref:hypothetical protein n=1 Tax=Salipaludibacillus sp. HK11 TaxID=3394320 RepID=UPI0039FCC4BC